MKNKKSVIVISILVILLVLVFGIPTLAKLTNRNTIYNASSWDGTIANSYKSGDGTKEKPYIISNGSEYAFFLEQLKNTDYADTYFELNGDIIINSGIFDYSEEEGIKYIKDGFTYYVKENTDEYYDNNLYEGNAVGKINKIAPIERFKGNLNGKSFTIYGSYIYSLVDSNSSMFKTLEGTINNLYISNSIVYGIGNVSGLALNSNGATIQNVIFDGEVINNSNIKTAEKIIEPFSMPTTITESIKTISLIAPEVSGGIKSVSLTGEYVSTNDNVNSVIKLNNTEISDNSFKLNFGTDIVTQLDVSIISTTEGSEINFTNIKYNIEYYDDNTSGLILNSNNTSLTNVINKSNIYGNYLSSGFVSNVQNNLQIKNSYNTGFIKSEFISSGLIGTISNNSGHTTLTNVYNSGEISSSMPCSIIAKVINSTGMINIENSINYTNNYAIGTGENSSINIVDSYSINNLTIYNGTTNGVYDQLDQTNLYSKDYLLDIGYKEFVNSNDVIKNINNVWIYENNSRPILYIDDINNVVANLNLSKYSWNNLSDNLNLISISNNITFSIEDVSLTNPVKEKYYYVTNSRVPLTLDELNNLTSWIKYENMVTIDESGYYVIYAKILDSNDNITYINSDIMVLDNTGFKASIIIDDKSWIKYKEELNKVYFNKDINVTLFANNSLVPITTLEYYVSKEVLKEEQLSNINEWQTYTTPFTLTEYGDYVIYVKIIDEENNISYVNTDYLLYGGYEETVNLGTSKNTYDSNYITNNSSLTLTFKSNFSLEYKENYTHNLISSILLPKGTKLTLINNKNNKIYKLEITTEDDLYGYEESCKGISNCSNYATYDFSLFKELSSNDKYYDEVEFYGTTINDEEYKIIIDFKNTTLVDNYYDISFSLAIKNEEDKFLYKTIDNSISNLNIYSNIENQSIQTTHTLNTNYLDQVIYYNTNSQTDINLEDIINYTFVNEKAIIDTTYENKKSGILIGLYNENNEQVTKDFLNNILIEYNNNEFFADSTNQIKINLGSVVSKNSKTLSIKTKENNSGLSNGNYYLKIQKYISNDGYTYDSLYTDELIIPVVVSEQVEQIYNYDFNVSLDKESLIIDKKLDTHLTKFNVVYFGDLSNPNIRVSLYEKAELTAYNQDYRLIDLKTVVDGEMVEKAYNVYEASLADYELNLIPKNLNNNGYKYVFELYDGDIKVGQVDKYFIVK